MSSRYWRQAEYELIGGGDENERTLHAVVAHLTERVGQQRMPVAIAPIDGQVRAVGFQFSAQGGDQRAVLVVDGALAAEAVIILGHLEHALARDVPSAQDVLEKRHHVLRLVGPAEREQQHGIVAGLRSCHAFRMPQGGSKV